MSEEIGSFGTLVRMIVWIQILRNMCIQVSLSIINGVLVN